MNINKAENTNEEKPLSVIIDEFKGNLQDVINTSSLPPYLVEPILKDIYNQVFILSQQIKTQELNEYNEKQKGTNS